MIPGQDSTRLPIRAKTTPVYARALAGSQLVAAMFENGLDTSFACVRLEAVHMCIYQLGLVEESPSLTRRIQADAAGSLDQSP